MHAHAHAHTHVHAHVHVVHVHGSNRFPTEDKGDLEWILNVAVVRDRAARSLSLSQSLYVSDLLSKYACYIDKSVTRRFDAPLDEGQLLSPDDSPVLGSPEYDAMTSRRNDYMAIVGGLLWLANMTRYDIAFVASQLARFLTNPGPPHFTAAIRVLCYLRHDPEFALEYRPNSSRPFATYVDSSWATKFSCSGAFLCLYGCAFAWFSKMQRSVTLSSAEAEFFGAMLAAREMLFAIELFADLGLEIPAPAALYSDSKSAVDLAFDPVAFKKTKHILRAAEYLRDLVSRDVIVVYHTPGRTMIADILTKAVARAIFVALLALVRGLADGDVPVVGPA